MRGNTSGKGLLAERWHAVKEHYLSSVHLFPPSLSLVELNSEQNRKVRKTGRFAILVY